MKHTKMAALVLALTMALSVSAFGTSTYAKNAGKEMHETKVSVPAGINIEKMNDDYTDYSFKLMAETLKKSGKKNVMISPASAMIALEMSAAGAKKNTLTELTDVFSEGTGKKSCQIYAKYLLNKMNKSENVKFSAANAAWYNKELVGDRIKKTYISDLKKYFNASVQAEDFNKNTVNKINKWVKKNTDGMVDGILDKLKPEDIMVLANAVAFEGGWDEQYDDYQVTNEKFKNADGTSSKATMLNCTEAPYFETKKAVGFLKPYKGRKYGFLVMLPKDKKVSAKNLLSGMTGEDFRKFVKSKTYTYDVNTKLPEFKYDFDMSLVAPLKNIGVKDAFDRDLADFSGMATPKEGYNISISDVLHKTHIELDKNGTKAAAVTAVIMMETTGLREPKPVKQVYCDRPFAYAIVDMESMIPIFIGTVDNL